MLEKIERVLDRVETSLIGAARTTEVLRRAVNGFWIRRHNIETSHEDFFKQQLTLEDYPDRMPLIAEVCAGRDVLHVGCADWPIFNPVTNLHLKLATITRSLAGLDTNVPALDVLRQHYDGTYYTSVSGIRERFDVLLVPEVIEHVTNVGLFLAELDTLDFGVALITGPNALAVRPPNPWWQATYYRNRTSLVEFVHPDHKCYFSPYTIRNAIESSTSWRVSRIGTTSAKTSVFTEAVKSP